MSSLLNPAITLVQPVAAGNRFEVMGSIITFRTTAADTDGMKTTFDMIAPPGVGVPMHVHEHEDELFVIRRGKVRFVIDGKISIAGPGETAFGPRNVPHSWEAIGDEDLDATVTILPSNLETMFRDLGALPKGPPDLARVFEICATHGIRFL